MESNETMPKGSYPSTRRIDRRSFVARASLVAAGSAFGCSLVGCQTVDIEIPCLAVVPPPTPVAGMIYVRASQIGCALDCNLENGKNKYTGGPATDDAPLINAAMAAASQSNPITLIIDGSALISGLFLPAGGYWSIAGLGCGTGFFVKTGTNNDGIHNGPPKAAIPSDPGPPAPPRGANISLCNFTLNGNRGNGHNGDSTSGAYQGIDGVAWYFGINLMNLENIAIQNVVVVNSPAYHIRLSNVGHVTVSGCVLRSRGVNTDGLHFDGPANDITISDCQITSGDDAIALNCPEGYTGNIERVAVTNCVFNSLTAVRLYSTNGGLKFNIGTVTVSNCSGMVELACFSICDGSNGNYKSVDGFTVSDCTFTAPAVLDLTANFGTVILKNVTMIPTNLEQAPGLAFVRSAPIYGKMTYVGSSLTFDNCVVSSKGTFDVSALILEYNSTIDNLVFNGFVTQAHELLDFQSGSIGQLVINAIDSSHIKAPVSPRGFNTIGSVGGAGVLATGWEFPNAVMANGVPYISANSGLPSIKIDGVVEPYE
jgi:hypothetical protein